MPLFMDRHNGTQDIPTEDELRDAHARDLAVQDKYGVNYRTYWVDKRSGAVFCLAEAPSMEAAVAVHREAHGEVANEIIEVESRDVSAFLGRLDDPPATPAARESGLNPFRTIVFTDMARSTNLTQQLGDTAAMDLIRTHNEIVRDALNRYDGTEIKHTGDGIMACFASVTGALQATIAIQQALLEHNAASEGPHVDVRVGLSAGEPVQDGGDLFGAAVQLARRICDHAEPGTIFASNVIRELAIGKPFQFTDRGDAQLKGFDDPVRVHEVHWSPD